MLCMLMHLLHGDHSNHVDQDNPAHHQAAATEAELAELRGEVRALREMLARLVPPPATAADPRPREGLAEGAHHGQH
jgi:hypothetical protein